MRILPPSGRHGPRSIARRILWQGRGTEDWRKAPCGRSLHSTSGHESEFRSFTKLSGDHAHLPGTGQRRASTAAYRVREIARFGRKECERQMSTATLDVHEVPTGSRVNYLNAQYGVKSWLLTTDHKRIALLYLASITLMFFVGGFFAVLVRLHLIEPQGPVVQPETYNKLFTMHGVIMVFFFLVPSIPATLGNFLVPMMIGARDLAF